MGTQIEFALRQSVTRVLSVLAAFLPGVLALLLALVIFAVVGSLAAWIARRVLRALHFDERLVNRQPAPMLDLAEWSPAKSPTLLIARTLWWLFFLAGVAVGLSALDASYSTHSAMSLFLLPYVTHLIGATLIVIAGVVIARFVSRSTLVGAVNAQLQYARFLALGVKWLVITLACAMALDHLGIGGTIIELAFGILFGGIVLTLALAVGIGSRDLVTRSIERSFDKPLRAPVSTDPAQRAAESLRHF
jgi:hypothetical protein